MAKLNNTQDFIEKYYPNYESCSNISENNDLQKILDNEIDGDAETLYNEIREEKKLFWGGSISEEDLESEIITEVENRLNASSLSILEKAVEGYIESIKEQTEIEKFARKCSVTGKGMNEGFCFGDGDFYCSTKEQCTKQCKKLGYKGMDDAFKDDAYYWTEWEVEEGENYFDAEGNEYTPEGELIKV